MRVCRHFALAAYHNEGVHGDLDNPRCFSNLAVGDK